MFRTMFNDPRPANLDELHEAAEEIGLDLSDADAEIIDGTETESEPYNGWHAEIRDGDCTELSTVAWEGGKEQLESDLRAAGVSL